VQPITDSEQWDKLSKDVSDAELLKKLELEVNEAVWSKFEAFKTAEL
jgi:hypothetical protein